MQGFITCHAIAEYGYKLQFHYAEVEDATNFHRRRLTVNAAFK